MSYEALLEECYMEGVKVKEVCLKGSDGRCRGNRIAVNKNISTQIEKRCVLAEELGHYYSTVGNILDQNLLTNIKQELVARRWAYRKLLSLDDFIRAYEKGLNNKHDIAEYLGVTETFLAETVEYYKAKKGTHCKIGDYLMIFEPRLAIVKMILRE